MADFLSGNYRDIDISATITLRSGAQFIVPAEDIYSYTSSGTASASGIPIGEAISYTYTMSVTASACPYTAAELDGAEVRVRMGVRGDSASDYEYVDAGAWYVTDVDAPEASSAITIKGSDALNLYFGQTFSDTEAGYPITMGNLLALVCAIPGVAVKSNNWLNSNTLIAKKPRWSDSVTLRSIVGYIAACAGGFAQIDPSGQLEIITAGRGSVMQITPEAYTSFTPTGGAKFSFNCLRVVFVPESEDATAADAVRFAIDGSIEDNATNCVAVENNPLYTEAIAASVRDALNDVEYSGAALSWLGDPRVCCGHTMQITVLDGQQYKTLVTNRQLTFDGGLLMTCTSSMPTLYDTSSHYSSSGRLFNSNGTLPVTRISDFSGGVVDAMVGKFDRIIAGDITTDTLGAKFIEATKASIGHLDADSIDANVIKAGTVTADKIASKTITADQLKAGLITAESGIIADGAIGTAQIADGSITSAKVVELNADVIKAGTLSAERLVIVGEDGIIYRLNAASSGLTLTELEKDEYKNYINGTVIVAKSITAAQIAAQTITGNEILAGSITAKEIDVSNLFAAEATIQALNAMDITGNTYLKLMVTDAVDGVQVGGTNLIRNGGFYQGLEGWTKSEYGVTGDFRSMYVTGAGEGEYTPAEVPVLSLNAQNETGMFGATQVVTGLRKNTVYTVSGYVASHRCNVAAIEVRDTSFTHTALQKFWNVGLGGTNLGEYDHFAFTFDTGDYSDYRVFFCSNSYQENGYLWWAQLKLEEGDRATAWSPSPFDPAEGVKTSYIEIADDHIDISSGGNVNIEAGSALNVNSGTFDVTTGDFSMSLAKDDGTDVVMDIDDDGHTTFKAIHAGNVREAEYGYNYYDTASMGSLQAMADYLARTDARAVEYQMSADEYGHVTLKEYNGYFKIYAAGHKLPKITVANSFTGTLWISTGYLSSEGGAYGDKWALTVDGGNVFTTNCWFAPGTTAGIMVEYGGIYRWLNWNDLSGETGYTLDPFIYAASGGIAHVIGGIPAGGRDIWHGFIYVGAYLSEHGSGSGGGGSGGGGSGGSGSTVSTASVAGTLGYYGSSNGWHAGECFQGYSNAKGRAYGCLAFDLSGVGTIQSAKLTLHRKSGVGLNRKANVTVYGTTADLGSNPANGLTSAYVSSAELIGWDDSATLDVTAAAQALKAGTIKQLVIYTGETGVYSGKAYSYHYAQFDSATLEVAYT